MNTFTRSDQSVLGRWWWAVDRWTLAALVILMVFGLVLIQAATPAVAVKHGLSNFYFVQRQLLMLVPALILMFGVSLLSLHHLRLWSLVMLVICVLVLAATPFIGIEIKGAVRWIQLPGFSFQPSEFVKPPLTIVSAMLFARYRDQRSLSSLLLCIVLLMAVAGCLISQPDIGMTLLVTMIWFGQFFLAGMSLTLIMATLVLGMVALFAAYYLFPHFTARMDGFLGISGDSYQADRAIEAFTHGGVFGTGPGEGTVKMHIPDAHADFIFAVAGEELGLLWCLAIIGLFLFIILRGLWLARQQKHLFILLAIGGLMIEFGVQAAINMASTLSLIPPKGMTLPFISYGGSSLWALALEMGMLLALTRKRYGET